MTGPCRVCELVDGDKADKPVQFCTLCGQWMCDNCRGHYGRRALAAALTLIAGRTHGPARDTVPR
jgi:hypothetical protein